MTDETPELLPVHCPSVCCMFIGSFESTDARLRGTTKEPCQVSLGSISPASDVDILQLGIIVGLERAQPSAVCHKTLTRLTWSADSAGLSLAPDVDDDPTELFNVMCQISPCLARR